jgi:site-specific recombinase XerD
MENNDKNTEMSQSCKNAVSDSSVSFIQELKLEWCKSKEQHKSFERDLLKFAKMLNDEQFKIDNFSCEDYYRCEKQCEFCKEKQK